jgi:hypothetical protein
MATHFKSGSLITAKQTLSGPTAAAPVPASRSPEHAVMARSGATRRHPQAHRLAGDKLGLSVLDTAPGKPSPNRSSHPSRGPGTTRPQTESAMLVDSRFGSEALDPLPSHRPQLQYRTQTQTQSQTQAHIQTQTQTQTQGHASQKTPVSGGIPSAPNSDTHLSVPFADPEHVRIATSDVTQTSAISVFSDEHLPVTLSSASWGWRQWMGYPLAALGGASLTFLAMMVAARRRDRVEQTFTTPADHGSPMGPSLFSRLFHYQTAH